MSQKDLVKAIQSSDESIFNQIVSDGKNTSLEGESFKNSQIGAMRIHTINMANTEWEACLFDGTTFENVDLEGAFFNGCTFHDCHFIHIANFSDTAFDGCVWKNSEIADPQGDEDGKIECLEISNCQFRDCILRNIQFAESTLQSLSRTTVFAQVDPISIPAKYFLSIPRMIRTIRSSFTSLERYTE